MSDSRIARALTLALAAVFAAGALVLTFAQLGAGSLWNTDDALYGHVVRTMVDARTFSQPQWFDYDLAGGYPLGVAWMALVGRVAGASVFGLRLSAAIAAVAGLAIFSTLRDGERDRRGLCAASLLVLQPLFFVLSQRVMHDALLATVSVGAIALYHRALRRDRALDLVGAGALCAAGSLVKIGAGLLPLAVIGVHVLLFERRLLRHGAAWVGFAIAIGVPLGWLAWHQQVGPILGSLRARIFVGFEGHGPPSVASPGVAPTGGLVSTLRQQGVAGFVLYGLAAVGIVAALRRRDRLDRLALVWLVVTAIAVVAMRTYLPHYALAMLLPLSLCAGIGLQSIARLHALVPPLVAGGLIALLVPLVDVADYAHFADQRIATLAQRQASAPPEALLCTVDVYHASSVFYSGRKVTYLTEHESARRILHRVFGEETVPTLRAGELVARLDAAPAFSCLVPRTDAEALRAQLRDSALIEDPQLGGPDVVLLERGPVR